MCFCLSVSVLLSVCQALRLRLTSLSEAQRSAQSAQLERSATDERLRSLQRALAVLETEKKDAERQAVRLEKDKNALRNTLDKVQGDSAAVPVAYPLFLIITTCQCCLILDCKGCT